MRQKYDKRAKLVLPNKKKHQNIKKKLENKWKLIICYMKNKRENINPHCLPQQEKEKLEGQWAVANLPKTK